MKKSLTQTEAGLEITLAGDPLQLQIEVNRLYNFGAIAVRGIPDDYREGIDTQVILKTYRRQLILGLLALAENSMHSNGRSLNFNLLKFAKNKKKLCFVKIIRAAKLLKEFKRECFFSLHQSSPSKIFNEVGSFDLTRDKGFVIDNTALTF